MPGENGRAALYLRSSKDRSDISPAAQRHALEQLAASRSLVIAETFEDAVESGSTEDRPGWQCLAASIRDRHRGWTFLLVHDTARIARRRHIAQAFKHQLKRRGITLLYATLPANLDPVSELLIESNFEAFDEAHSLISKQKGLAGMAENVRRGWRAGGRAPIGYQLAYVSTGAVREGRPVMKSKLEPSPLAHQVRAFLKGRARGVPRMVAARMSQLAISPASYIGLEWNALTYAGHTVWNMHREPGTGSRRRPREEWHINKNTHEAMITELEAERILANLELANRQAANRAAQTATSRFLLAGVLFTTDGRSWVGHGPHYRLRTTGGRHGRLVRADELEHAVSETLRTFRTSDRYLTWLRDLARQEEDQVAASPIAEIDGQIRRLERERARAADAAVSSEAPQVYFEVVEQRTRQIEALKRERQALEREASAGSGLRDLTMDDLRNLVESQDPVRVAKKLIERVVLEPDLACQIQLRRHPSYNRLWRPLASPGGSEAQPQALVLKVVLAKRA